MTTDLQTRIAAIKAECKEIIRLEKSVVPNKWSIVPGSRGGLYDTMVVSGGTDPTFVLDGYRDDCAFIAHFRNVSPAMARVVVAAISYLETRCELGSRLSGSALEDIANQWEGK